MTSPVALETAGSIGMLAPMSGTKGLVMTQWQWMRVVLMPTGSRSGLRRCT